jgi:hypothetical protein
MFAGVTRGNEAGGMTSSRQSRTNYGRRFFWFALAIAVAIAAYTGGWFYAARALEGEVNGALAALNGNGRRASCEEPQARGFPFRLGLFCRSVMYEDARRGVSFQARALRSAAQIYQPWRVVGELDAPGRLEAPGLSALALGWESLRASARLARPLPERISLEARGLDVGLDEQGAAPSPLVRAQAVEVHMRPAGDDLDLALRVSEARPDATLTRGVILPPLSGLADLVLSGGALPGGMEGSLRGRSGLIRSLTVSTPDGAGVTVSGPVSVDEVGLVDAELQLMVREPLVLAKLLGDLAPQARREIELAASAIATMGGNPGMPLRIVKGEARLGFITLGDVPPL